MKVLLQEWSTDKGWQTSISKDREQLDETIQQLKTENRAKPEGEVLEVTIPDDHGLAGMVEDETVFLCSDEMDVIEYPDN
ncbi:MAG: hypothetical protein ACHQU0_01520 [Candidatus Paceibacteria bacterium]